MRLIKLFIFTVLVIPSIAFAAEVEPEVWYKSGAVIIGMLLALSEVLAFTPLKSNGILNFIVNILKTLAGKEVK